MHTHNIIIIYGEHAGMENQYCISTEALTVQIGRAVLTLSSFFVVLSFYGESLGGRGFINAV